ncbi:hypothetical protein [Aquidulcibacter sp.]|uniref:hypothetical protein n=1 Tax=Aquidulcibacter sp. TaxID=2052990 RepID=UPI0025BE7613|nr:hypothetical protein [Aquidulcibacter sp.]MCA3693913.1 hypothetical protein [Aquidulcibacter sp.]
MTSLSPYAASASVPYRHKVTAVPAIEAITDDLKGSSQDYSSRARFDKATQDRGRYDANSAAAGFSIHVLVEAGLTGEDPFAALRGAKAYQARMRQTRRVQLVV